MTSFDTATSFTTGVGDKSTTTTVGEGSQSARTHGSGTSINRTRSEGLSTSTYSHGTSTGSLSSQGRGVTRQKVTGTESTLTARVVQSGKSTGRGISSIRETSGDVRQRTHNSGTTHSSGSQTFEKKRGHH